MTDASTGGRQDRTWREREAASRVRGVYLDPHLEPPGGPDVHATVYVADELLIAPVEGRRSIHDLDAAAQAFGWAITEQPLEDPPKHDAGATDGLRARTPGGSRRKRGAATTRVRISVAGDRPQALPAQRPDAWRLLRELRRAGAADGVGLNHVLTTDSIGVNPFKANPFKANPFKANPFTANAGVGIDSYAYPGFGGRQPVTFVGPAPAAPGTGYRPVVAIFDTGCGEHPWFDPDVLDRATADAVGVADTSSDPDAYPSLGYPLDGLLDEAAGHGTFIAGIVRQACPDARIVPVRIADGHGVILESELLGALGRLVEMLTREKNAFTVDVLNLSFSYYHESPEHGPVQEELYALLRRIRGAGCVVVCSAGNDATDRPAFPAALYDWPDSDVSIVEKASDGLAPHVAVGALNPSDNSVALFSNLGAWVGVYAPGVAILSTLPVVFDGGVQAGSSSAAHRRRRETLDIDDFRGGFAVWSGTSFAAPLVAGRIARRLGELAASSGHTVLSAGERGEAAADVVAAFSAVDRSVGSD